MPLSTIVVIAEPEQIVCDEGVATAFGIGFTTTVARNGGPEQPLAVGVMVKVTVTAALVVLVNVPLIVPVPLAAIPVTVATLSRVQLNTVPATLPLGIIGVIAEPLQIVCVAGAAVAFGVGFTSTVAVIGVPVHVAPALVYVGVIVKVTVTGILVRLVNVPLILPVPLFAIPVTDPALSLVQLYTVPATLPDNTMVVIATPEHTVCDEGVATAFGTGFTTTVEVIGVPPQALAVGVIVKVTVTGAVVVLVSVPDMLPDPLAAIPVTATVLSLVQLYVVPATLPLSTIVWIAVPEHDVCEEGVATALGVGFTSTVAVIGVPIQVAPALV